MDQDTLNEVVNLILFGDIHEAPLSLLGDLIDPTANDPSDLEGITRSGIASTLIAKYGTRSVESGGA